ncbi:protein O-mannosyl-transferase TMTC2-like [Ischnura elegans]|uniref:protein O-mannosyl-transferase TMTC2-like n=1 Tax=Ischnura elegans TaxID=197161 RepID=UPI001ED891E6|nr:protein O-mannosyl-transferase TMTC2-like [Ischnura elegans]
MTSKKAERVMKGEAERGGRGADSTTGASRLRPATLAKGSAQNGASRQGRPSPSRHKTGSKGGPRAAEDPALWIKIACALFAFLLYVNTVDYGFVYDDHRAILTNDDLLPSTPITALLEHDFWGRPIWHAGSHKSYRPLAVLSLRINDALAGGALKPGPLHLGNAILHAIVTALLTHFAALLLLTNSGPVDEEPAKNHRNKSSERRGGRLPMLGNSWSCNGNSDAHQQSGKSDSSRASTPQQTQDSEVAKCVTTTSPRRRRTSSTSSSSSLEDRLNSIGAVGDQRFSNHAGVMFTGLLFACHPVHTEAVCGLVGRADIAASLFSLLALVAYRRHAIERDSVPSQGKLCSSAAASVTCLVLSMVFGVAAMLSKEHGLAALPLCVAYDALFHCKCRPVTKFLQKCLYLSKMSNKHGFFSVNHQTKFLSQQENWPMKSCRKMKSLANSQGQGFYRSLLLMGIATSFLLAIRCAALAGGLPSFSSADNPAARSNSTLVRTLTFLYLPALNMKLLLCPLTLSFDWSMNAVPLVKSLTDPRNIASISLYMCLIYILCKLIQSAIPLSDCVKQWRNTSTHNTPRKRLDSASNQFFEPSSDSHITLFALAMVILPFLPSTNLIAYVGFVIAERVLYAPSMGFCLLLGLGFSHLLKASSSPPLLKFWGNVPRIMIVCSAILLVITFTTHTLIRSMDWRDEESLYRSGIKVNPAKAYGNLGNVLSNRGRTAEAETAYRKALLHRPNMADAHFNLGLLLQNKGELFEAIECYKRAVQFRPSLAVAHLNMGLSLVRIGKWEEGIERLRLLAEKGGERVGDASLLKDPRAHEAALASARFHLGRLLAQRGHLAEALETLQDALNRMPPHYSPQSLLNMLGEVYRQLGQEDVAEEWFRASLQSKPDHIPAHLTYARLLADNKTRIPEAEKQYLQALRIAPRDVSALHQYGRFLVEQGRHAEAAEYFKSATEAIEPPQFEDVMAAATSYRLCGKLREAEIFYRMGVQLRPKLHSTHVNLGALLHLTGRLDEARKSYEKALSLKPGDQLTLTNLQRLQVTKPCPINSLPKNSSKQSSTHKNGVG